MDQPADTVIYIKYNIYNKRSIIALTLNTDDEYSPAVNFIYHSLDICLNIRKKKKINGQCRSEYL